MENINEIRRNAIAEIKEKVKRNKKYLSPVNKERLEDMKRLLFDSGSEFTVWMQNNGILRNPTDVSRENQNKNAQNAGFKNYSERIREWTHKTGRNLPLESNKNCSSWFGEFTEKLMIHHYPGAKKMPYGNPWFDYLWNENEKELKIDNKGKCLYYTYGKYPVLIFPIEYNNIADRFILSGWNSREDLTPLFVLEFKKDDLIRYGQGGPKIEFWKRVGIAITYPQGLEEFKDHQIDTSWLKSLISD